MSFVASMLWGKWRRTWPGRRVVGVVVPPTSGPYFGDGYFGATYFGKYF